MTKVRPLLPMTTAEIEAAANRGNLATSDFNIGQVLRRQVIPNFLEDVGICSWRKLYKSITTIVGTQAYDLDANCLKVHEVYRLPDTECPLKYIGEDPLATARAEATTTNAPPTAYYVALTAGAAVSGTGTASFGAIPDGEIATQTFTLAGASVGGNVAPGWPTNLPANLIGLMRVSAANTVEVRLLNMSGDGSTITPGSLTFTYTVLNGLQSTSVVASNAGSLTFGAIPDGEIATQTFTMAGVTAGANVSAGWPSGLPANIVGMMRASATNTIEVRLLNMSRDGSTITPGTLTFAASVIATVSSTPTSVWQSLKLQAPADAVYALQVIQLTFIPFSDDTTSVDLRPYIPLEMHWTLVSGLQAQIALDRFKLGDPRYDRYQQAYLAGVEKAKSHRELARRNYFISVR